MFFYLFLTFFALSSQTNVHVVMNSHNDVSWIHTYEEYLFGTGKDYFNYTCAKCIYDRMPDLLENSNRTFSTTEILFLIDYLDLISNDTEKLNRFKALIFDKKLHIAQIGLSVSDESLCHYDDLIDQYSFGYRKVYDIFGIKIRDQLVLDNFGISYTNSFLLRKLGIENYIFDKVNENELIPRITNKTMEFYWGSPSFFTHIMPVQYNNVFDDYQSPDKVLNLVNINKNAFKNQDEILLIFSDDFKQWDEDKYEDMEKTMRFFNIEHPEHNLTMIFSNIEIFLNSLKNNDNIKYPYKEEYSDFLPKLLETNNYWTGFYTTSPQLKKTIRKFGILSRSIKNMLLWEKIFKKEEIDENLYKDCVNDIEKHIGLLAHHDTMAGTLRRMVMEDIMEKSYTKEEKCRKTMENSVFNEKKLPIFSCNLLENAKSCIFDSLKNDYLVPYLKNGEYLLTIKIFNPTNQKKEVVEFQIPEDFNMEIFDINMKPIPYETFCESILIKICFLTLELTFPAYSYMQFYIQYSDKPILSKTSEIVKNMENTINLQLSYNSSLIIGENLENFTFISQNLTQTFKIDYKYYQSKFAGDCQFIPTNGYYYKTCEGGFREYSGSYVMKLQNDTVYNFKDELNYSAEYYQTKFFTRIIIRYGEEYTIISVLTIKNIENEDPSRLIININSLFNDNFILDWSAYSGKEMILTVKLDEFLNNSTFYTDSNALFNIRRTLSSIPDRTPGDDVPANYYPIAQRISIIDENKALSLNILTEQAHGGTSYREGELEIMLERYIYTDDDLGLGVNMTIQSPVDVNNMIIIGRNSVELEKDIARIINKGNFINIPFIQVKKKEMNKLNEKEEKHKNNVFLKILNVLPDYIKLNFHPIDQINFILRVQDVYSQVLTDVQKAAYGIMQEIKKRGIAECIITPLHGVRVEEQQKPELGKYEIITLNCKILS